MPEATGRTARSVAGCAILEFVQASPWDEDAFFRMLEREQIRYLLVGRRACVVYGLPVLTSDWDFVVDRDAVQRLIDGAREFELYPSVRGDDLAKVGFFKLENDEKLDVFCAREYHGKGGSLRFEEMWDRRRTVPLGDGRPDVHVPHIRDLITFKLFQPRKKDLDDVRLLEAAARERGE